MTMTTKRYYKLPPDLQGPCEVRPLMDEWPINNHPSLRYTRKKARWIRRKRQLVKKTGIKNYLVPIFIVTFP